MRLLRAGGRLVSCGYAAQSGGRTQVLAGFLTMRAPRSAFLLRDSLGFFGVNLARLAREPGQLAPRVRDILDLWRKGALKPHIGGSYRLDEAARAHEALENRLTTGKLLLIP
jgi:NADPH:quinone reductase-like Zn-dependent oxidoreductase